MIHNFFYSPLTFESWESLGFSLRYVWKIIYSKSPQTYIAQCISEYLENKQIYLSSIIRTTW